MTIKRCLDRHLCNKGKLCNILLYCVFFAAMFLLHYFTNLKPQDVLPLFFFPFFHFILLGIMLYLLMSKACSVRKPALLFLAIVIYIMISVWGFQSNELRSVKRVP